MNSVINALSEWLLYSSLLLVMVMLFIQIMRKVLIRLAYSRTVVLKLWLAVPLSLLAYFVAVKWMVGHDYIEPMTFSFPVQIQALSESASFYFDWRLGLLLLWLMVGCWKVGRLVHQYIKAKHIIIKHSVLIHDNVYHTNLNLSPMAFGFFKPMIVLPNGLQQWLTPGEFDLMILHETIHCRRADPLWRFSLACLHKIYWFLPGFGFSQKALIEDQEFACDEQVISESRQHATYAQLLLCLNVSRNQYPPGEAFNESILCSASFNLKERIMKLDQVNNKKYQANIISLFLIAIFAISSASALPQVSGENAENIELIPTYKAAPMYPFKAVKEKISGHVTLTFTVTKEGTVENVEVVDSTPAEIFDKEAVIAMEQWTFEPIAKDTKARQMIEFELDEE